MAAPTVRRFTVANPSPYPRASYVSLPLHLLELPSVLTAPSRHDGDSNSPLPCGKLELIRERHDGFDFVPYQIDAPFGLESPARTLTFLATNVSPGPSDYALSTTEPRFVLRGASPSLLQRAVRPPSLWTGHYYADSHSSEPEDGFSWRWDPSRLHDGVKLANEHLELYVRTGPIPAADDLVGSVTSLRLPGVLPYSTTGDFLRYPSTNGHPHAHWGRLSSLTFFPPPWDTSSPLRADSFLRSGYEVVWANAGPIRATVTLASRRDDLIALAYSPYPPRATGQPRIEIRCRLFRVFSLYEHADIPCYEEEVHVVDVETGERVFFAPSYAADVPHSAMDTLLCRFEHIPDYFAIWKHFGPIHRGLGFAANSHVRDIAVTATTATWELVGADRFRCIHCFTFLPRVPPQHDPFHDVGHHAWYSRAYADLRARIEGVPFDVPTALH